MLRLYRQFNSMNVRVYMCAHVCVLKDQIMNTFKQVGMI